MPMALVLSSTPPGTEAPETVLSSAVQDFQDALSDVQRHELQKSRQVPGAGDVIAFTSTLDLAASDKGRTVATRLHTLLESVSSYTAIVDTFVSSHPEVAALVWGSVRFAMNFASNYTSYFEQFSALFVRLTRHYPRFVEYQALYPASERLKVALAHFYAAVIRSCKHLILVIQRSFFQQAFSALWQSFTQEFGPDVEEIERCGNEVKAELKLAKAKMDQSEQSLQSLARAEESGMRHKLKGFFSDTTGRLDEMKTLQTQQNLYRSREHKQLLLDRLSSHDYLLPYKEASRKRLRGTAEWIFNTTEFNQWRKADTSSVLLCSGKIGSGKTIVSSSAIAHVLATRKHADDCVTFFFIRQDDAESQKAEVILRSILRQSLLHINSGSMSNALQELDENPCPTLEDLAAIIRQRRTISKSFYIFIDGLNECEQHERRDLLDSLASLLCAPHMPAMKLFVATQESLDAELKKTFPACQHVSMASDRASSDTNLIIDEMLHERTRREDLIIGDSALFNTVQRTLAERVDGMILWASFLIDELCECRRDDDIRQALLNLPRNLEDTFTRALMRIVSRRKAVLVERIFAWVAVAKRNLTTGELRDAISIEIGQVSMDKGKLVNGIENIAAWCENLVQLDDEHDTVRFAHSTIHEFITNANKLPSNPAGKFHVDLDDADHHAGEICVTYLHLSDFTTTLARRQRPIQVPSPAMVAQSTLGSYGKIPKLRKFVIKDQRTQQVDVDVARGLASYKRDNDDTATKLQQSYPLLQYVKLHWIFHTKGFNEKRSSTWGHWLSMVNNGHALARIPWPIRNQEDFRAQRLEFVLNTQHHALFHVLIQNMEFYPPEFGKRLVASSAEGDARMVGILLPEVELEPISKALLAASRRGHLEVVDLLIAAGANVNTAAPSFEDSTALQAAALGGHLEVVDRLLSAGADVNAPAAKVRGRSALLAASERGHLEIIRRLLAAGAVVNASDGDYSRTALLVASERGHLEAVNILLAAGAESDPQTYEADGSNLPLVVASGGGHLPVVELLLKAGAKVDPLNLGHSFLPVVIASRHGHVQVVDRLIAAGADVATHGYEAFREAARCGHLEVIDRLLRAGVDADIAAAHFIDHVALRVASEGGHSGVVDRLLEIEFDNPSLLSAVESASHHGHLEVVNQLLAAGADVSRNGHHCLSLASENGHQAVVVRLRQAGAKTERETWNLQM